MAATFSASSMHAAGRTLLQLNLNLKPGTPSPQALRKSTAADKVRIPDATSHVAEPA